MVLELARQAAPLAGVASFHGELEPLTKPLPGMPGHGLVYHSDAPPYICMDNY